ARPTGVVLTTPAGSAATAEASKNEAPAAPAAAPAPAPQPEAGNPSPAAETASATPPAGPSAPVSGLFDLDKWRRGGPDNFQADLAELKARADSTSAGDRNKARLDLAEFYLANGYGAEATTWAELVRRDDRTAQSSPLVTAIAAAAYTMADDRDTASRLLESPALQGVPEANLMRALIAAERGRTEEAAKLFGGPLPDLKPYPKAFRTRVREAAAKALLEYGDPLTAQNYLDPLKADDPDPEAAAQAGYLDGLRLAKLGQKDAAKAEWEKLQDSPIDEIRARSRFALVSQALDDKSIDPADAARQLEALRYLWRGDTFEFDLLYKLGKLYFDAGQPRKSLITLRQAATHFPDHPLAKQAAADMADEFRRLYLGGAADKLSPLTAVGLYDEFRELTPPGAEGDRMIAALADRLVKLDLFDRAGDILERQVKTRLAGIDKVKAGTRLAAIRLLDDKPDLALSALKESEDPAGSPDLVAERKRLQARALFDIGETLNGLDLVRNDTSLEGLWLKSDMFWKLKEWPSAAEALGQLIEAEQAKRAAAKAAQTASSTDIAKNPATVLDKALADAQAAAAADAANAPAPNAPAPNAPAPNAPAPNAPAPNAPAPNAPAPNAPAANGAPAAVPPAADVQPAPPAAPQFDPVLASLVMNRAVALSLANDRRGLKELGRDFGKDMAGSALAEPFQVLTSPDTGLAESITAQMKSVDQLGSFVDEYKKILTGESLSGTTEPKPDTGPIVPMETPNSGAAPPPAAPSPAAPSPTATPQTAEQAPAQQPTVQ
ncbi:MAG TPA: tetratricopeptide repeat protein, partial [Dongiaceae bacterium]|nr:tetratricopeptide repeat protein [Dongiaceae bacterium]